MHVDGGGEISWIESHRRDTFSYCPHLLRAEFGEALETISGENPFGHCSSLTRIAIPLKANLFDGTVDLVGSIHDIVSSFHLKTWIDDMTNKINQINLDLPALDMSVKTMAIHEWMQSLLEEVDYYKTLHLQ
jgi:hypothetical protein